MLFSRIDAPEGWLDISLLEFSRIPIRCSAFSEIGERAKFCFQAQRLFLKTEKRRLQMPYGHWAAN